MWVRVSVRVQSSVVMTGVAVGILVVLGATGDVCVMCSDGCIVMCECSYGCTYTRSALESVLGMSEIAVHVSMVLRWILKSGVGLVKLGVTLAFC